MSRYLIYAEGQLGTPAAKTGHSVIRYSAPHVAAVLDSTQAGKCVSDVLGFGGSIPIVATVDEGAAQSADALLVGIAVAGGGLPPAARTAIRQSIECGLDIWNGLHAFVAGCVAGASEAVTIRAAEDSDIVRVEGQGSILHPGYSGVSLGLLHGSLPHALIVCHQPTRKTFRHNAWLEIPPLNDVIALHEAMAAPLRQARTIGVSLNTSDLSDDDARRVIEQVAQQTGLPTTDPVRYDVSPLADAVAAFDTKRRSV